MNNKSDLGATLPFSKFIDSDLMVFKDGSLGAGFTFKGFDSNCKSHEQINSFSKNLENALFSLPDNLKAQVFFKMQKDEEEKIKSHEEASNGQTDGASPELKDVTQSRLKFLKEREAAGKYFRPEIYIFLRSTPVSLKKRSLFEKENDFKSRIESNFKKKKKEFLKCVDSFSSNLSQKNSEITRLKSKKWFDLIFLALNLKRALEIGTPDFRDGSDILDPRLCEQLSLTDFISSKKGVEIDGMHFKVISLKTLPGVSSYPTIAKALYDLDFHFWLSQSFKISDQPREKKKLELSRRVSHSMAAGSANVSDLENESKFSKIEGLLTDLIDGKEKLASMDLSLIIWDTCIKRLEEKQTQALKAFRSMEGAEGVCETYGTKDAFLNALPGSCIPFRQKILKTSNVAHLAPVFSNWRGNKASVCLLEHKDRHLFSFNPFAPELANWNGIVFGGSGSGKSFSIANLMLQFTCQKPRPKIIWIDNGASAKRLALCLGGQFLDLSLDSKCCMNMFDLPPGQTMPTPGKVRVILAVLEQILKEDEKRSLPKREKALLEAAIFEVFEKCKETNTGASLSKLKEHLARHEVPSMKEYSQILYSWTGDRAYGRLLDGPSNVFLEKDLVCIELGSLATHSDLKDVLLLLLTHHIEEMAKRELDCPYLCIVDEAERLFQTELARQFVVTCFRTWRKYRSGIWCLSQNYKDFMADPNLKDSLLPNTANMLILKQKKIDWEDFKTCFDFNPAQVDAIKALKIKKGEYSELYLQQDENQAVLKLRSDPLSYWLCTSDAADKTKIDSLEEKTSGKLSTFDALKELATK